jgi:hypothetical protein
MEEEDLIPELRNMVVYIKKQPHIHHFLVVSIHPVHLSGKSVNNTMVNKTYLRKMELYLEYLREKDYQKILLLLDKHTQIKWFLDHYDKIYVDIGEKNYFQLLRDTLVYVDQHYPFRDYYPDLIHRGNDPRQMMNPGEMKKFNKLPDEFVVYRGINSTKKVSRKNLGEFMGNSWSLDREISIWFGKVYSQKFRDSKYTILLKYEVRKQEVISYFTDRREEEIFLDHENIDIDRISVEYIPEDYKVKV